MSGLQQVHLRVNDAATGKPTPVRIRVTDAEGRYYAPFGRLAQFATGPNQDVGGNVIFGGKPWAYIDGACEINLPPGKLHVSIAKGPEYTPVEADLELMAGKLALRSEISRWCDVRREGWHSGDTRVHFLPPHAAILEAQAEDVAIVHLLARKTEVRDSFDQPRPAIPNLLAFSGQAACVQTPGHAVVVNTENYHPELGSLGLLHCHRVVHPLTFGGPNGVEDWSLADWCGQCHRKQGLVVWTRTMHESEFFDFGEPLVDLLLGYVDAFELIHVDETQQRAHSLWYDLLNIGLRVPLAGSSGKDSSGLALGVMRTYVNVPGEQEPTTGDWIEGLRAGRSFVTNGPLLEFTVNGVLSGSVAPVENHRVRVRAEANSWHPYDRLELIQNGVVVSAVTPAGRPSQASLDLEVPIAKSGWLAARCTGARFAHSTPIYVEVPGMPMAPDRKAVARFAQEVDRMSDWCRCQARCPTPHARERLQIGFLKAREILAAKMA